MIKKLFLYSNKRASLFQEKLFKSLVFALSFQHRKFFCEKYPFQIVRVTTYESSKELSNLYGINTLIL